MNLGVSLLLVAPGELPAALVAAERLFAGVGAHVGRQMIAPREGPHADPALERLLTGVDAYVSGELVAPRESPVAAVDRAGVRSLVDRRFAGSVGVLSGLDGNQPERHGALLVDLGEDLMAF